MRYFTALLLILILTACGGGKPAPAQAVENYYAAMLAQDAARFDALVCPDFSGTAQSEFGSFAGVEAKLDGLNCSQTSTAGSTAQVQCQGKIVATYGTEKMDIELGDRIHQVTNQDGAWRVCGY